MVVKGQTLFIWHQAFCIFKDARPRDAEPEAGEAHARQQAEVLVHMMIEINGAVAWIVDPFMQPRAERPVLAGGAAANKVLDAGDLSARVPGALELSGGEGASPEKVFWKWHGVLL